MMKKIILGLIVFLCTLNMAGAQILTPVKWSYGVKRLNKSEGIVFLKATIDEGWHLYSQTVPNGGPTKTTITFEKSGAYELMGTTQEPKPITRVEMVFNGMTVSYFVNSVIFQQKVRLKSPGPIIIKGNVEYMTCDDEKCIPADTVPFSVIIK
jgi:hypothetical protein